MLPAALEHRENALRERVQLIYLISCFLIKRRTPLVRRDKLGCRAEITCLWSKQQEKGQWGWELSGHSRILPSISFSEASCLSRWALFLACLVLKGKREWGKSRLGEWWASDLRDPRKTNLPAVYLLHIGQKGQGCSLPSFQGDVLKSNPTGLLQCRRNLWC